MRLSEPELSFGIDGSGRFDWPSLPIGFDPEALGIEKLTIEDGRAVLTDAGSGSRLLVERISFEGEVRSLIGPFRGEGAFSIAGQHYPYRVSGGRVSEGGLKLRLGLDPIDRPLTAVLDGTLSWERGEPRFEGALALSRRVATVLASGTTLVSEPWRATSRIKATPVAALLEQVEFQYGPEERAIRLAGAANFRIRYAAPVPRRALCPADRSRQAGCHARGSSAFARCDVAVLRRDHWRCRAARRSGAACLERRCRNPRGRHAADGRRRSANRWRGLEPGAFRVPRPGLHPGAAQRPARFHPQRAGVHRGDQSRFQ